MVKKGLFSKYVEMHSNEGALFYDVSRKCTMTRINDARTNKQNNASNRNNVNYKTIHETTGKCNDMHNNFCGCFTFVVLPTNLIAHDLLARF